MSASERASVARSRSHSSRNTASAAARNTHRSVMGIWGEASESLGLRARFKVKWAVRTGEIRWHVSAFFLRFFEGFLVAFFFPTREGGQSRALERERARAEKRQRPLLNSIFLTT